MQQAQPQITGLLRVPAQAAKTRRERVVGLPASLHQELLIHAAAIGPGIPLLPANHRRAFWTAQERIDYTTRRIHLRDLRHCYATISAQGTGDAAATQAALGHAQLATTQRYLTATLQRTVGASAAVSSALIGHTERGTLAPGVRRPAVPRTGKPARRAGFSDMEVNGIEPMTSCVQSRCSSN